MESNEHRAEHRDDRQSIGPRLVAALAVTVVAAISWLSLANPASARTPEDLQERSSIAGLFGQRYQKVYLALTMDNVPGPLDTFAYNVGCPEVPARTLTWPEDIYFGNIFSDGLSHYVLTAPSISDADCSIGVTAPEGWTCQTSAHYGLAKLTFGVRCTNPSNPYATTTAPSHGSTTTIGPTTTTTIRPTTTTTIPRPRTTPETIEW